MVPTATMRRPSRRARAIASAVSARHAVVLGVHAVRGRIVRLDGAEGPRADVQRDPRDLVTGAFGGRQQLGREVQAGRGRRDRAWLRREDRLVARCDRRRARAAARGDGPPRCTAAGARRRSRRANRAATRPGPRSATRASPAACRSTRTISMPPAVSVLPTALGPSAARHRLPLFQELARQRRTARRRGARARPRTRPRSPWCRECGPERRACRSEPAARAGADGPAARRIVHACAARFLDPGPASRASSRRAVGAAATRSGGRS